MGATGRRCKRAGIYESNCGDRLRVVLFTDETFPPCDEHDRVSWSLVAATDD